MATLLLNQDNGTEDDLQTQFKAVPVVPTGTVQAELVDEPSTETKKPRVALLKKSTSSGLLHPKKKSISVPALLLLVFSVPASFLYGISFLVSDIIVSPDACNDDQGESSNLLDLTFILQNLVVFLLFPFAGWLSDTKLGRYKTVYYSIWTMWSGMGIVGISFISRRVQPCDDTDSAGSMGLQAVFVLGKYVFPIVGLIVISIGAAGYFPNVLALMMEQLIESSSALIRSYIYWFAWAVFVGFFFSNWVIVQLYIDIEIYEVDEWFYIPVIVCFAYFSGMLIACFFSEKRFVESNVKMNPYRTVYDVVCFAIRHKYPINRSSLTFWEENLPGRMDLAKTKYGGPFKHEEVEDVKTLFRMILLFFSLLPFFVAYSGPLNQLVSFIRHLKGSEDSIGITFIYLSEPSLTIVAIPLLELIILPLFPKFEYFIQKPLRWMLVGVVGVTLSIISLAIIDAIAHSVDSSDVACFINTDGEDTLNFDYRWTVLPTLLWGFCDLFITVSMFTFICSQAPYTMIGMLLGLFLLMQGLYKAFGSFLGFGFDQHGEKFVIGCGFWYWITLSCISIVGCVVFFIVAFFYKSRERWEVDNFREMIEKVYEKQLQQEKTGTFSFSYITKENIPSEKQ